MIASKASLEFWTGFAALPPAVQSLADKQFRLFLANPHHASLRLKPVGELWSVRVTRSYRALARKRDDTFYWFWIGTHEEYDRIPSNQ